MASLGERAIAGADQVVAVGTADPIGLTRLLQGLPDLTAASAAPICVVINRVRRGPLPGSPRSAIERALSQWHGPGPDRMIPVDAAVDAAVLAGRPLCDVAPRSPARGVIADLTADLVQSAVAAAPSRSAAASLRRRIARSSGSLSVATRPSITKKTAE
jgi:MinD-like ATPase involved in chromosome partitioning or flagellar assembly